MTNETSPRPIRWRPALAIIVGGALLVTAIRVIPEDAVPKLDSANRFLATSAAVMLTCLLVAAWFVFFAGLSRRSRWLVVLILLVSLGGLRASVKQEGFTGNMVPVFTWRWAKKEPPRPPVKASVPTKAATDEGVSIATNSDFPQFLGPERNAKVTAPPFALDWSATPPRTVWRQPIGAGWSSFAVVGDFAVTQEQRDEQELVVCYRRSTGEVVWTHSNAARHDTALGGLGPRATPTIEDGAIYTLGATGILNGLDLTTGKPLWEPIDLIAEHGATLPDWGKSGSPLVVDNLVIVSAGGPNGHSLVAYDKESGELAWNAGDDRSSYASPVLATLAGVRQIVMLNADSVVGHDAKAGTVLWRYEWPGSAPKVPDPVAIGDDRIFISAGYGVGCQILQLKNDAGKWSATPVWAKDNIQLKPKFTNVIVHDGFVYGLDDGTALACLDLATGKRKWKQGRYGHGQLLLVNDVLLVQAEDGQVALVEPNPDRFRELTRFSALADKTWNTPVVSGRCLLVRNANEAACYELPLAK
jgi:outer membrane protein assembly factor BamB